MKTRPFNLEEALAGKPLVTRDGRRAKIIYKDQGSMIPIRCQIEQEIAPIWYSGNGQTHQLEQRSSDLFMLAEDEPDILDGLTPEQVESVRAFAYAVRNQSCDGIETVDADGAWVRKSYQTFLADHNYRIAPAPEPKFKVGDRVLCKKNGIRATVTEMENGKEFPIRAASDGDKDIPWEFREEELTLLKTITRPWTLEEAEGKWVRLKTCDSAAWKVQTGKWSRSMQSLFDEYVQLDGSPCGVQEEVEA